MSRLVLRKITIDWCDNGKVVEWLATDSQYKALESFMNQASATHSSYGYCDVYIEASEDDNDEHIE